MVDARERKRPDKTATNQTCARDWEASCENGVREMGPEDFVRLEIPIPPMLNHYWRHIVIGGRPRTLISSTGRDFKKNVSQCVQCEKKALRIEYRVKVGITVYPPDRRKRDIDGYLKALLDSMTDAGVWIDDEQVDELVIRRGPVLKGGKAVVTVQPMVVSDGKD